MPADSHADGGDYANGGADPGGLSRRATGIVLAASYPFHFRYWLLNFYHRTQQDQCCSHACLPMSIAHADPAYLAAVLPLSDRLNSMNSTLSGRLYDSRVNQQALLGPRRPRPHKIWKKKFIKVHSALRVLWVLAFQWWHRC